MQAERENGYNEYVDGLPFSHPHMHSESFKQRLSCRAHASLTQRLPAVVQGGLNQRARSWVLVGPM